MWTQDFHFLLRSNFCALAILRFTFHHLERGINGNGFSQLRTWLVIGSEKSHNKREFVCALFAILAATKPTFQATLPPEN